MKIGIDIRCLLERYYSGISYYTQHLLEELLRQDAQNEYVLFSNASRDVDVPKFSASNVTYKSFRYPNKFFNLSLSILKKPFLDRLIGGVDLFISPHFLFTNIQVSTKKMIIVHDLSFELFPEFFTAKKRLWHHLINPKRLCQQADSVIAISESTKQDLVEQYGINAQKITVIYPGVSDVFFSAMPSDEKLVSVAKKYNLPKKYILYLGNLEPRKNVEALIRAFDALDDQTMHLVLAGVKAWKHSSIEAAYKASPNKDRIHLTGYIDERDKPYIYDGATVFAYPSFYEGFGLPPAEAMARGIPVITSHVSSLPEVVGNAGILIDPYDIQTLVQALNEVLGDSQLSEDLSRQGNTRSRQFTWNQAAAKLLIQIKNQG